MKIREGSSAAGGRRRAAQAAGCIAPHRVGTRSGRCSARARAAAPARSLTDPAPQAPGPAAAPVERRRCVPRAYRGAGRSPIESLPHRLRRRTPYGRRVGLAVCPGMAGCTATLPPRSGYPGPSHPETAGCRFARPPASGARSRSDDGAMDCVQRPRAKIPSPEAQIAVFRDLAVVWDDTTRMLAEKGTGPALVTRVLEAHGHPPLSA